MGYEPIENYGCVGNQHTVALISNKGSLDFCCFPYFDSPTVFAALIDKKKGGSFYIAPKEKNFTSKQYYLSHTNVLVTRFHCKDGIGEVMDLMPIAAHCKENALVRKVYVLKGAITFCVKCAPRFHYGMKQHQTKKRKTGMTFQLDEFSLHLTSNVRLKKIKDYAFAEFSLRKEESVEFILSDKSKQFSKEHAEKLCVTTIHFWKSWCKKITYEGLWKEQVLRSALTLKLLFFDKTGALVAAPTFGLPEKIGGKKNWDYRYVWIRDSSFTIFSLLKIGLKKEAKMLMHYLYRIVAKRNGHRLFPCYKLDGSPADGESQLKSFEGYKKSPPLIGNDAAFQFQLDNYGELIDAFYLCDKYISSIPKKIWLSIFELIEWLKENWNLPDSSIWETDPKKYLFSRIMCWVAFDRGIKIARRHEFTFPRSWEITKKEIHQSVFSDFWHTRRNAFVLYKGSNEVDASALLMPLKHFISFTNPKWQSTLKCIEKDLANTCMLYRFKNKIAALLGIESGEGTFSSCSFWYVECLSKLGKLSRAQLFMDELICNGNALGLFSEQIGMKGEHLGNFPQALTHLSLICSVYDLNGRLKKLNKS